MRSTFARAGKNWRTPRSEEPTAQLGAGEFPAAVDSPFPRFVEIFSCSRLDMDPMQMLQIYYTLLIVDESDA